MMGGFRPTSDPAGPEEQAILAGVKDAVESHLGKTFTSFVALEFTTQVVAGVNYLFKVQADDEFLIVKVCKPLPHTNQPPFMLEARGGLNSDAPLLP